MWKPVVFILCSLACIFAEDIQVRIIAGSSAILGQFPHQASLRIAKVHYCGGSIIDNVTILTSARCVEPFQTDASDFEVVVGTNALIGGGDFFDADRVLVHKNFSQKTGENDIALIKIKGVMEFDKFLQPINLSEEKPDVGSKLTVSGWGFISYPGGIVPNELQFVNLDAIDLESCAKEYDEISISQNNVCTQAPAGKGVCVGDAGGALINREKQQVGIVSWAEPCATGKPDVYTSVPAYLDWIRSNL